MEFSSQPETNKISKYFFLLLVILLTTSKIYSQNVAINASGNPPDASAGLDVDFPDKGLLIPRVALTGTANFAPLSAHVAGMLVYNTAAAGDVVPGFYYNDGSKWISGLPAGNVVGNMLYWNGTNWVLIPVGAPGQYLQLSGASLPSWGSIIPATPSITTSSATLITTTTATSGANIGSDGGSAILSRGICWNTLSGPTIANSKTTDGIGIGIYTSSLTGLLSGTTYYVRAYAMNSSVINYGNEVTFTTLASAPVMAATTAASSVTGSTATTGGNVTSSGGAVITERGVCYGTVANPTTAGTKVIDGAPGVGAFTSNLTGLTGGTVYYVRSYAINNAGTGYGTQISFTTAVTPPTLVTAVATSISGASATSGATMNWNGGGYQNYQNYGIAYSLVPASPTPTFVATNTANGSVNPLVNIPPWVTDISGLAANTTYYIRSYLNLWRTSTSSWITVFGNELTFTTTAPSAPVVGTTTAITGLSANTANSGGAIISDGGSSITAKGVCWGTSPDPVLGTGNFTTNGSGTATFISNISGLTASTTYYVRAYATNSIGTSYSPASVSLTTWVQAPYTLGQDVGYGWCAYVAPDGSGFIVSYDIPSTAPWGCSGTSIATSTALGSGQANTNLILSTCATRPIAASVADNYTGGGFTDWYLPSTLEWGKIGAIATTVGIGSFLNNYYTSSQSSATYVASWFTNYNSGYASGASKLAGVNDYINQLRAIRNFGAASPPTVTTEPVVTNIGATTATSGGNVTNDGGAPILARGICWSTAPSPTIAGSTSTDGTGVGAFVSNISGLTVGTLYYIRAYATNIGGTAYGSEVSFTTTSPTAPIINTEPVSSQTSSSGTSGGTIVSDGGDPITVSGICWSTTTGPTIADSKTTDGTPSGTFNSVADGLTAGTTYYIRAYATNGINTGYGNEINFTPAVAGLPVITTDPILNLVGALAEGSGTVVSDGGNAITEQGLCWSTGVNPTISSSKVKDLLLNPSLFYLPITGLSVGTVYHVRAYATNSAGTSYGSDVTFTATAATIGHIIMGGNINGVVYSIDGTGAHGLIADFGTINLTDWGCTNSAIGATGTAIGTGSANSDAIIADIISNSCVSVNGPLGFAPQMIKDFYGPDWYLPSKDEFDLLWTNRVAAGLQDGFTNSNSQTYWSSSEVDALNAWYLDVTNPLVPVWNNTGAKDANYSIWMIRSF